jgi:hypothetical protein
MRETCGWVQQKCKFANSAVVGNPEVFPVRISNRDDAIRCFSSPRRMRPQRMRLVDLIDGNLAGIESDREVSFLHLGIVGVEERSCFGAVTQGRICNLDDEIARLV